MNYIDQDMIESIFGFVSIIITVLIILIIKRRKKKKEERKNYEQWLQYIQSEEYQKQLEHQLQQMPKLPYKKKYLLTKNEWAFYKSLKPVADELGYSILAKIRVADLVEVTTNNRSEWQTYFNKINKKHVDFALAKPENLQIELLIELDDNSHTDKQKSRDEFVEALYKQTGYKLLRVNGSGNLKSKIESVLNLVKPPIIQKQQNETAP